MKYTIKTLDQFINEKYSPVLEGMFTEMNLGYAKEAAEKYLEKIESGKEEFDADHKKMRTITQNIDGPTSQLSGLSEQIWSLQNPDKLEPTENTETRIAAKKKAVDLAKKLFELGNTVIKAAGSGNLKAVISSIDKIRAAEAAYDKAINASSELKLGKPKEEYKKEAEKAVQKLYVEIEKSRIATMKNKKAAKVNKGAMKQKMSNFAYYWG